jgi:alpha-beta hydrolase superfamily lysophospholipase
MGLVRVMDRAAAAAASHAAMPALLLLGARDEIVPASRAEAVFAQLSGPRSVIRYAEGWHLLFRDRQAARVWRDVAEWTGERSPPQGCVAGADRWAPAPRAP